MIPPTIIHAPIARTTWGRYADQVGLILGCDVFRTGDVMPAKANKVPHLIMGSPSFAATTLLTIPAGVPTVVYTSWEATRLPEIVSEGLKKAARIAVPSRFCQDVLATTCDLDAQVIYHGVADEFINLATAGRASGQITIGIGGAWMGAGERKRLAYLVRIFHTIAGSEGVELRVRTPCMPPWANVPAPFVHWDIGERSTAQQVAWFDGLDGFMTISAGEGYDLMTDEAVARGLPVAGTDWGGTSERHLTVRMPYSLVEMRGISGFYPDKSKGALVSDEDIQKAFTRLMKAIENRRGTRVIPSAVAASASVPSIQMAARHLAGIMRSL